MPFTFDPSGGADFSASGTGSGHPNRLAVGDVATVVQVSDPDLSDLSGVTITYHWWAGGFHYTADLADPALLALGSGEFVAKIEGAHASSTSALHDDSAAIADLTAYATFSTTNLTGNVLANDSATGPLHVTNVVFGSASHPVSGSAQTTIGGAYGTLSMHGNGDYSFNLNETAIDALTAGFHTTLDFEIHVTGAATGLEHLTIQIDGANDAIVDMGATLSGSVGTATVEGYQSTYAAGSLAGSSGFVDPEGSGLNFSLSGQQSTDYTYYTDFNAYGTFRLGSTGHWSFSLDTSAPAYVALGECDFTELHFHVGITDAAGDSTLADVVVTVWGENEGPDAVSDTIVAPSVSGAFHLTGNLLANDTDPDRNDDLAVIYVWASGSSGSSEGFAGIEANLTSGTGPVTVLYETNPYGTFTVWSDGHYTLDIDPDDPDYIALAPCETAQLYFSYQVSDGHSGTDWAELTIVVSGIDEPPVGYDSTVTFTEDPESALTSGTLHFTSPDSGPLQVVGIAAPTPSGSYTWDTTPLTAEFNKFTIANAFGTLEVSGDSGHFRFTLDNSSTAVQALAAGETHTEQFEYMVTDGYGATDIASINVVIHGMNDAPVAPALNVTAYETGTISGSYYGCSSVTVDLLCAATDIDHSDTLTIVGIATSTDATFGPGLSTSLGSATVDTSGILHFHIDEAAVDHLAAGSSEQVTIAYKVMDLSGSTDLNTVTITVAGANDAPVAATKMAGTAYEAGVGFTGASATGNLLSVISDVDDTAAQLAIASVSGVTLDGSPQVVMGEYGQLYVTTHGHYSYDVDDLNITVDALQTGESLADCFEYRVQDMHGAWVTNTIDISIVGHNDAPSVSDLAVCATESGSATGGMDASGNLLASSHACDVDGDVLVVTGVNGATGNVSTDVAGELGSLSITASGDYRYSVNQGAADFLGLGVTATDTFTVRVADGNGGFDVANIVVTVYGANDAPQAGDDAGSAGEAGSSTAGFDATGNVLPNDADPDQGAVIVVSQVNGSAGGVGAGVAGSYGTLTLGSNGSYHYVIDNSRAAVNALGPADVLHDVFTYTVSDGLGGTSSAQLDITIHGANDAPAGSLFISGTAATGDTLTAISSLVDPEGIGQLHYRWQSDGVDIQGASGSSFVVTAAQIGTIISVVVTYTDGGGSDEAVTATISAVPGQHIYGTNHGDNLSGAGGNDTIDGAGGRDTMAGGAGNDLYYVNDVHDVVQEGSNAGRDTVISSANFFLGGNVENLTLTGNATLGRGNDLDNAIVGNARNDNLTGYGGADTLTGGAGQDTFVYTALGDSSATAYDTILDFNPGQRDKLDLRQVDARDNVPYNQAFRWIGSAAFDPDGNNAGLLRFDPVTHMLEGSTNADANVEFRILLVGVDHLSMANILL